MLTLVIWVKGLEEFFFYYTYNFAVKPVNHFVTNKQMN